MDSSSSLTAAAPSLPPLPPQGCGEITDVNKFDVFCGRGSGPNEQAGNIAFRDLVATKRAEYLAVSPRDHVNKNRVANGIIAEVRSRGGRFLRRVNEPHEAPRYALADEASVVEKTKQALRQSNKKAKRPAPEAGGGRKSAKGGKPVRPSAVEPAPLTVPEAFKRGGVKYTADRAAAAAPTAPVRAAPVSLPFPVAMQQPAGGLRVPAPQAGLSPAPPDAAPQAPGQKRRMAAELALALGPAQSAWDVATQQQHLAAATLQQRAALHQAAPAGTSASAAHSVGGTRLVGDAAQYHLALQQQRQAQGAALSSPEAIHAARLAELQLMAQRQQQFEQAQQIQHAQAAAHAAAASEEAARRARQLEQMRMEQIDLLVRRQRESRSIDAQAAVLAQRQALRLHGGAQPAPASPAPSQDAAAAAGGRLSRPPSAGGQLAASALLGAPASGGGGGGDVGDLLLRQQTSEQAMYAAELEGRHRLNQAALSGEDVLRRQVITNLQSAAALGDVGAAAALSELLPAGGPPAAGRGQADAASTGSLSFGSDERLLQQLGELQRDGSQRSVGSITLASLLGARRGDRADSMSHISSKGLGRLDQCLDGSASLGGAMSVGSGTSPGPHGGSGHGRGPVASPGADLMRPGAALETPLAVGQELSALSKAGSGGASWGDARLSVEDRKSREPSDNSDGSSKIDLLLTAHKMREKQQGREASASVGSRLSDDVEPPVAGESVEDSSLTGDRRRTSLSHYYRSFHRNGGAGPMDCS